MPHGARRAAGRKRLAALAPLAVLAVLATGLLTAGPALAHSEGLTPYRYVVAPQGVDSEGPAESGISTQPLGQPGFAGTTDNQMQLTLPAGVLPARTGQTGVRVQLDQLDPAQLPPLPAGLEPEGNGYRISLAYVPSGMPLGRLAGLAVLGLTAPAPATGLYELVRGGWVKVDHAPIAADSGFSSVVRIDRPGTFLQGYNPRTVAPAAAGPARSAGSIVTKVTILGTFVLLGTMLFLRRQTSLEV